MEKYCDKYLHYKKQYLTHGDTETWRKYKKYKAKYKRQLLGGGNVTDPVNQLTVVTYNIANLAKGKKDINVLDNIIDILRECQADVICLQEVGIANGQNQAALIAKQLDMDFHFEQASLRHQEQGYIYTHKGITKNQGMIYGNAVLGKKSLHMKPIMPVRMSRGSLVKDNGERMSGADEGRVATAVIIHSNSNPRSEIICISTHLAKHNSYDKKNGSSLIPVSKITEAFAYKNSLPSILAGDLNVTPTSPTIKYLSRHGWQNIPSDNTRADEGIKIDYIMPRNSKHIELKPLRHQKVITTTKTQQSSDHLPLVAKFQIINH